MSGAARTVGGSSAAFLLPASLSLSLTTPPPPQPTAAYLPSLMHERAPIVSSSSSLLPTPSLLSLNSLERKEGQATVPRRPVCLSVWAAAQWSPLSGQSVGCRLPVE